MFCIEFDEAGDTALPALFEAVTKQYIDQLVYDALDVYVLELVPTSAVLLYGGYGRDVCAFHW